MRRMSISLPPQPPWGFFRLGAGGHGAAPLRSGAGAWCSPAPPPAPPPRSSPARPPRPLPAVGASGGRGSPGGKAGVATGGAAGRSCAEAGGGQPGAGGEGLPRPRRRLQRQGVPRPPRPPPPGPQPPPPGSDHRAATRWVGVRWQAGLLAFGPGSPLRRGGGHVPGWGRRAADLATRLMRGAKARARRRPTLHTPLVSPAGIPPTSGRSTGPPNAPDASSMLRTVRSQMVAWPGALGAAHPPPGSPQVLPRNLGG